MKTFLLFTANSNTLAPFLLLYSSLFDAKCRNERINHETDADGTSSKDRTLFFLSTASPPLRASLFFLCRSLGKPICRLTNTKEIDCDLAVSAAAQSPAENGSRRSLALTSLCIELGRCRSLRAATNRLPLEYDNRKRRPESSFPPGRLCPICLSLSACAVGALPAPQLLNSLRKDSQIDRFISPLFGVCVCAFIVSADLLFPSKWPSLPLQSSWLWQPL